MSLGLRIVFASVLAVSLVGCGAASPTPSAPTAVTPPNATAPASDATTVVITITSNNGGQSFSPNPATIAAGQSVIWFNADSQIHHVVLNDGTMDSGELAPGASSAAKPWVAVSAQYHCSIHPGMVGSVNDPTTPPSSGDY